MIISKIMEDPQSGSCLNLSYSDVTGPVANFNPIGSPYANTGGNSSQSSSHHHHHQSNVTNSNASYSSNGSLNSLSPTLTNSFSSAQGQAAPGSMMQFSSMNLGPAITNNSAQLIESIKAMLRVSGYTEEAVSEICSAMNTLANYGMLGLGLGLQGMFNGLNAQPPIFSNLSMPLPGNQTGPPQHTNNCAADLTALGNAVANNNGHQHLYSSTTGVPNLDCNNAATVEATSGTRSTGNNLFGPVGSSALAGLNHSATSGSPNGNRSTHNNNVSDGLMPDNFDPFRRSSPSLGGSPGSASGPNQVVNGTSSVVSGPNGGVNSSHQLPAVVNNNSFGLGTTVLNTSSSPLRKSPQNDHNEAMTNIEVEIGDNIVGAILGHKGESGFMHVLIIYVELI